MKTTLLAIAALALALAPAMSVFADQHLTAAEVRKVDLEAKKITLKHEPIKSLDMPTMTMVFQIRDPLVLERSAALKAGDKIMFSAQQLQGAFVVTQIEAKQEAAKK